MFRQQRRRPHADADDNKIGFEVFAIFQRELLRAVIDAALVPRWNYLMLLVKLANEISGIRSKIRSIGIVSGATTSTSMFRARSDAATSRPMKLAPITTARREV